MATLTIGQETSEKYNLEKSVQQIAVDGSKVEWWRSSNDLPYICLEGRLTTPDGLTYPLEGGEDVGIHSGHPPYLKRSKVVIGSKVQYFDAREDEWVEYSPEPISLNEIRDLAYFHQPGKESNAFMKSKITWTRHPESYVLNFFKDNPLIDWVITEEGVIFVKTEELSNGTTYWYYQHSKRHGKKEVRPVYDFAPGK